MTGGGPRVAFFGSPAFALPVLDAIREHFQVVLVGQDDVHGSVLGERPVYPPLTGGITATSAPAGMTSASSANHQRISYTPPVAPPARKQQTEEAKPSSDKIESRSDNEVSSDKLESRADNIESRSDSSPVAIDFPTIAMNSFFGRIK